MKKGTSFALVALALIGGFALGRVSGGKNGADTTETPSEGKGAVAAAPSDGVNRIKVPLEGTPRGPAGALVNVVVFSDFQCPFCGRLVPNLERLQKDYPGKVALYFRHNPLPFHADAPLASEAALEADAQGKFWEMHDKLFANQQNIKRPDLEKYAQELGLDMTKFKAALDTNKYQARIAADTALGTKLGVQGTPNSFVNGRSIEGAVPYEQFKTIVDDELARANKLVAAGTPPAQVYARLMASAREPGTPAPNAAAPTPPAPAKPVVGAEVYKVSLGDSPVRGGKEPKVTLVEFSDFQCPFCSRVTPTLKQIEDTYKDDVAVVWKHLPLPFHPNAMPAALAAEAAREQGKFWEMHDKLFANQQAQTAADFEKYAQEIGLNMAKFKASVEGAKGKPRIEADQKLAEQFGARGTPTFFINGRTFRGAQPFDSFKSVIDEELKKADAKLAAGASRKNLYAELTSAGLDKAAAPAAPPGEPAAGAVMKADIGDAPIKGAKDALVTIVQFSDFQCPFCSRVEPTIDRVMKEYDGKVRVVWKDLPLPFHQNALPSAIAAREAKAQGKFWPMHDKLFANQSNLDRASLEKYAQEIGLNMAKFKAALDSNKWQKDVEADSQAGAKIGARGTPAFFINGIFLSGAQPFESFKARIDEELKKADGLVKKGTPKSKVYDTIMKAAKAELAAAPAAPNAPAAAPEAGPESDKTVYKVEPGHAPSRGPKNAAITAVLYSDFQCPFCKRVEPTLEQIEKDYPGKVRVVWKNFPLEFHPNAKPAAKAALAANDQGKFWEMHKKLFENQTALDRPNLEKYAQELGLNMAKFKEGLDSDKYDAQIQADTKEGQALGVNGTPATFINGRKIGGAYPLETFKKIVDQELAKKKGS